jgi:putative ABC transport system permease protein
MRERLLTDLRYAIRLFARTPVWTAAAILSLSLGMGINLLIFSIVDAVLLRPFPYRDPSQLVFIWGTKNDTVRRGISGLDLADWQMRNRSFESLDAFLGQMSFTVDDGGGAVPGACIGPSVLPLLGVQPALGRNFVASDARPGADTVAIVSDGFWRTRMAGSAAAIGSTLRLDGRPYEVVGVTPAGFFFPDAGTQVFVSTPCGAPNFFERGGSFAHAVGRLRSGVSAAQAEGDLDAINRDLARIYPETNRNVTAGVQPFRNIVVGKYEKALWLMLGSVGLVLLIACANVAHLQLARSVDRQTELAVRAASGAGRARLFRQLLTETLLLSAVAGGCAVALAWWGVHIVRSLALSDIARLDTARIDLRLAASAAGLSLLCTLIAGIWPAWKAAGVRINDVLKTGGGAAPPARRNLRELLATTELALATVLLILAGLLIGSFVRLSRAQWGFDPNGLLLVNLMRPPDAAASREGREAWTENVRSRVGRIAGVEAVASADGVPIQYNWRPTSLVVDGRKVDWGAAGWTVSHGYFRTIGTPILEGREFSASDTGGAPPAVVISRALARKLWPGSSAVGRDLRVPRYRTTAGGQLAPDVDARMRRRDPSLGTDLSAFDIDTLEVIGVVEDIRAFGLDLVPSPAFYVDYRQDRSPGGFGKQTFLVVRRTDGAANVADDIKSILAGAGVGGEVRSIDSMSELVAHSIGGRGSNRLMMLVATLFGGLALVLTTIGIFGVMLHTVNQRLPELGIRIALGASRGNIARLVLGDGVRVLLAGLALGLTLAWVASRSLRSLLFELTPTDLPTYAAGSLMLAGAVLLACLFPLRRAVAFDAARLFRS